jgi:hypothetical protein
MGLAGVYEILKRQKERNEEEERKRIDRLTQTLRELKRWFDIIVSHSVEASSPWLLTRQSHSIMDLKSILPFDGYQFLFQCLTLYKNNEICIVF